MVVSAGPHTYRVVGTKLKRVRRKNSDGEEPQEHEAADGRVLNMWVGCGEREQTDTDSPHNTVTEINQEVQKQQVVWNKAGGEKRTHMFACPSYTSFSIYQGSVCLPSVSVTWRHHT